MVLFYANDGHAVVRVRSDAYSVKHITYRWMNGAVGYNKEMQLPQFEIKGFRVVTKLEKLSTGISLSQLLNNTLRFDDSDKLSSLNHIENLLRELSKATFPIKLSISSVASRQAPGGAYPKFFAVRNLFENRLLVGKSLSKMQNLGLKTAI